MQYTIFNSKGFDDYKNWIREDKSKFDKINSLITSIQRDGPLKGIGQPEVCKHDFKGNLSRRIDQKNRLIYQVQRDNKSGDSNTIIKSCKDHYKGVTEKEKLVGMIYITGQECEEE